ncbi:oxygenase MpaB family protein [Paenarthrobacter ureafaciens]|uniref:oxygenase MpaB family protein n=1 Tax=Paenarthrobacter ureafaciens TaxID=37931 RepID=UPI002DB7A091|nr:oxygenase MpaB family protein [Paenarthrobacter ureafaciens]MEC3853899.1 oxygenase MpaB family protein [Paenarthrobacter ureafaciens]
MRTKPRKWIREELARLDPHQDYERIIALNTSYHMTDFLLDYVYAFTFPNFIAPQHGSETVLRGGTGKIYKNPNKRMDDTSRHMLIWWENGPSSPLTRRSVESVNRLHEHWAKTYPDNFSHTEDYVYTLCYEAAFMHRMRLRLGLSGFDEGTQTAAIEFWSRMALLFRNAGTGEPITEFPTTFQGVMDYMDWYEGRDLGANPHGADVIERMLTPFAERHFPKPLHPIARALVLGIYPPHILRSHGIKKPSPLTQRFARSFLRFGLVMSEKYAADPEETIGERHRRARDKKTAARTQ